MKKILSFIALFLGIIISVSAQDNPLKAYIGKYSFAAGSPVAEVTITLEDTALIINSAMGSTVIEKKATDTFYLAQYDANIVFKRGTDKMVTEMTILVQGMELVGKKEPETVPSPGTSPKAKFETTIGALWLEKQLN